MCAAKAGSEHTDQSSAPSGGTPKAEMDLRVVCLWTGRSVFSGPGDVFIL